MTRIIKICGITSIDDALMAVDAGADWIGINFWRESKRFVDRIRGRAITMAIRKSHPSAKVVGVFVNHSAREIEATVEATGIDLVQLHGDETSVFVSRFGAKCIKALPMTNEQDLERAAEYECPWLLLDSRSVGRGGSGELADWQLCKRVAANRPQVLLAGGLHAGNVAEAIAVVQPYGVDVASGVEASPGIKDPTAVREFVRAARGAS